MISKNDKQFPRNRGYPTWLGNRLARWDESRGWERPARTGKPEEPAGQAIASHIKPPQGKTQRRCALSWQEDGHFARRESTGHSLNQRGTMVCCAELHILRSSIWGCHNGVPCFHTLQEAPPSTSSPSSESASVAETSPCQKANEKLDFPIVQMGRVCAGRGQKSGYVGYVMSPSTEPSLWEKPQSRGAVDELQVSLCRKWTDGDLQVLILFRKDRDLLWSWTESQPRLINTPAACSYSMMADPALIPSNASYEAHPKTC